MGRVEEDDLLFGKCASPMKTTIGKYLAGALCAFLLIFNGALYAQDQTLREKIAGWIQQPGETVHSYEEDFMYLVYHRRKTPYKIHIDTTFGSAEQPNIILVPGTGSYAGLYRDFSRSLAERGYNIYGIDFIGHGRSEGKRGVFTMREFLDIIRMVVDHIHANVNDRVGILGTSQGGEVAFIAALEDERIQSVVSHNVFDITRSAPMKRQRLLKIPILGPVIGFIPDIFINLKKTVDWKKLYAEDSLAIRQNDPHVVWEYSLKSYRTIFRYKPKNKISDMTTPVMIAVGEHDPIITPEFCRVFYDYIPMQKKKFYVMPGAGHQLLVDYTEEFVKIVDEWFADTLK